MRNEKFAEGGVSIREKATVIWNIANALFGCFKSHEYGLVVLPMTVVKRFRDRPLPNSTGCPSWLREGRMAVIRNGSLRENQQKHNAVMHALAEVVYREMQEK